LDKEKRVNGWKCEEKHELWLSEYDKYVLMDELQLRIYSIEASRNKVGISPDDKKAESNKHIDAINRILIQLREELK